MPFGIVGRTGRGMRWVVGFGDPSVGRVISGANMGHPIETNEGLSTIGNSHCAAASSQLGEFLEPQGRWHAGPAA